METFLPFTDLHLILVLLSVAVLAAITEGMINLLIDTFPKSHRLVCNGGFEKLETLYCSLNMLSSTEIS